jgi:hypothetical protein
MERKTIPKVKILLPSKSFWVQIIAALMIMIPAIAFFYVFIPSPENSETITRLGFRSDWYLLSGGEETLIFAGLWTLVCWLQALTYVMSFFQPRIGKMTGISQMVGARGGGRKVLIPLGTSWFAYGGLTCLLVITVFWKLNGFYAIACLVSAIVLSGLMIVATNRFWKSLDELVRVIWIESLAVSCGIFLLIATILTLGGQLDLVDGLSGFQTLMLLNWVYLFTSLAVMWRRAPEMLISPTLEDA